MCQSDDFPEYDLLTQKKLTVNRCLIITDMIRTVLTFLIFLMILICFIFIATKANNIENGMNSFVDTVNNFNRFINLIESNLEDYDIFNKTSIVLDDSMSLYDRLEDFNSTVLMNYANRIVKDLDKISKAIP